MNFHVFVFLVEVNAQSCHLLLPQWTYNGWTSEVKKRWCWSNQRDRFIYDPVALSVCQLNRRRAAVKDFERGVQVYFHQSIFISLRSGVSSKVRKCAAIFSAECTKCSTWPGITWPDNNSSLCIFRRRKKKEPTTVDLLQKNVKI